MEPTEEVFFQVQELKEAIQELKEQIRQMQAINEVQQESITSLIALSQKQTTVIEQQTSVIQQLVSQ